MLQVRIGQHVRIVVVFDDQRVGRKRILVMAAHRQIGIADHELRARLEDAVLTSTHPDLFEGPERLAVLEKLKRQARLTGQYIVRAQTAMARRREQEGRRRIGWEIQRCQMLRALSQRAHYGQHIYCGNCSARVRIEGWFTRARAMATR